VRHEPTYEGRPLARPDEEVVDQGLGFDLTTLMSRRRMLRALGLGAAAAGLTACAAGTSGATTTSGTGLVEIPDETAGPYPGDGSNGPNVLAESGIVRDDIRSSFAGANGTAEGVPLTIQLTILDIANGGSAFAGAAVYVWHCNRAGEYSMYSSAVQDQNYLRGVQVADAAGRVSFTSIFPACYSGRWPHIHFEVYPDQAGIADASNAIATSQIAIPQDACEAVYRQPGYEQSVTNLSRVTLATDNVFGDDGGVHELGAVTGDVTGGYTVSLTAPVDTTTTPTAGGPPSR
jgi:protocatechuate 3,4-dioxygenase beta subunit